MSPHMGGISTPQVTIDYVVNPMMRDYLALGPQGQLTVATSIQINLIPLAFPSAAKVSNLAR